MKHSIISAFSVAALGAVLLTGWAEQPDKEKGPKKGPGDKKGYEPGRVLPPFIRDQLNLTEDQEKKIADLEKDVRAKLMNILTDDQKQQLKDLADKGGKGPKDGPPEKGDKGGKGKDKGKGKGDGVETKVTGAHTGIQWYATWGSAKAEAKASGRPIFLVSATPHCAGVSGTW